MKWRQSWWLAAIVGMGGIAAWPVGKAWLKAELQRVTRAEVAFDNYRFNPLTGNLWMEGVELRPLEERLSPTLRRPTPASPIRMEHLWSQVQLPSLAYRRWSSRLSFVEGMEYPVTPRDIEQVPVIEVPACPTLAMATMLEWMPGRDAPAVVDLEPQQALQAKQATLDRLRQQLTEMEKSLASVTNPLRGREQARLARERLAMVDTALEELQQGLVELNRKCQEAATDLEHRRVAEVAPLSAKIEQVMPGEDRFASAARTFMLRFARQSQEAWRPYLAMSLGLIRDWMPQAEDRRVLPTDRGLDYAFGDMLKPAISCGTLRMQGVIQVPDQRLPFSGQLKNVGSLGWESHERPTLELNFGEAASVKSPAVQALLHAAMIPDRHGFVMQGRLKPLPSWSVETEQDAWTFRAAGEQPMIFLAWTMHHQEWSMDMVIECDRVRLAGFPPPPDDGQPVSSQAFSCYEVPGRSRLLRVVCTGSVVDGRFHQKSVEVDSPALPALTAGFGKQFELALKDRWLALSAQSRAASEREQQRRQAEWSTAYQQSQQTVSSLRRRVQDFQREVIARLEPASDLRLSQENAPSLAR
jgi:hypothetical protein